MLFAVVHDQPLCVPHYKYGLSQLEEGLRLSWLIMLHTSCSDIYVRYHQHALAAWQAPSAQQKLVRNVGPDFRGPAH